MQSHRPRAVGKWDPVGLGVKVRLHREFSGIGLVQ